MNSRRKGFWKQWNDRNRKLAEVDRNEANSIRDAKYYGYKLE